MAVGDDLLADGSLGVEAGVYLGWVLDAPRGRRRGVEYVEVDVVKGPVVRVGDGGIHDFGGRVEDVVEVDGDVLPEAHGAFGVLAQDLERCLE